MSTPIVFNGVNYSVPAFGDVGYAQGPGNLSAYLIAIASGTFQITGGLFSLTADANFGPNFGLVSIYYKSASANIAQSGVLRLANADTIAWRNFANSADLALAVNASNQLTFNGTVIGLVGGSVTSVTGTANQINSTGGTTPVLSLSSTLIVPGTFAIPALTNQIVLGTTNTITLNAPAPAASRVYTFPDVLGAADFIMSAGVQSIAGAKTFTDPITQNDVSNQLVLGVTRTVTLSAPTPASASRTVTIPDLSADYSVVGTQGAQTISGVKTFDTQLIGKGTATNDSAATGYIGEYVESLSTGAAGAFPATTQYTDRGSIVLTAGDWDLSFASTLLLNGATMTSWTTGVGTTAGNSSAGLTDAVTSVAFNAAVTMPLTVFMATMSGIRKSISSTTTFYLKYSGTYSAGAPTMGNSRISARRVR